LKGIQSKYKREISNYLLIIEPRDFKSMNLLNEHQALAILKSPKQLPNCLKVTNKPPLNPPLIAGTGRDPFISEKRDFMRKLHLIFQNPSSQRVLSMMYNGEYSLLGVHSVDSSI
jgi:hypothetical protein